MKIKIRRATVNDAEGVMKVLNAIIAERKYSAMSDAFDLEAEREFIASLGKRSALFVAEDDKRIIGFQSLEPFADYTSAMDHVGLVGTQVLKRFRGKGIGRALAQATFRFAEKAGYEKIIIYVRASNQAAQTFYRGLGFVPRGVLKKQVKIDGQYDDEVFMEMFLADGVWKAPKKPAKKKVPAVKKPEGKVAVRRAKRDDIPSITAIINGTREAQGKPPLSEEEVMDRLFERSYWVSIGDRAAGVAGWQVENLVTCILDFYVYPASYRQEMGRPLLEAIEKSAHELLSEVAIVFVDQAASEDEIAFLTTCGYERQELEDLTKIWREVASEFLDEGQFPMVKKLRESRIMRPV